MQNGACGSDHTFGCVCVPHDAWKLGIFHIKFLISIFRKNETLWPPCVSILSWWLSPPHSSYRRPAIPLRHLGLEPWCSGRMDCVLPRPVLSTSVSGWPFGRRWTADSLRFWLLACFSNFIFLWDWLGIQPKTLIHTYTTKTYTKCWWIEFPRTVAEWLC